MSDQEIKTLRALAFAGFALIVGFFGYQVGKTFIETEQAVDKSLP